jgi:hypothetical protein
MAVKAVTIAILGGILLDMAGAWAWRQILVTGDPLWIGSVVLGLGGGIACLWLGFSIMCEKR